jgi:hypothetical protein
MSMPSLLAPRRRRSSTQPPGIGGSDLAGDGIFAVVDLRILQVTPEGVTTRIAARVKALPSGRPREGQELRLGGDELTESRLEFYQVHESAPSATVCRVAVAAPPRS